MDVEAICKYFGLGDPRKMCGAYHFSLAPTPPRPYTDPSYYTTLVYKGKPFVYKDHRDEIEQLGMASKKKELVDDGKAKRGPPGTPKVVKGATLYPVRHFA